ncbi:MAG: hypothetical protein HQ582_13630 [Planctomycetes bacterium]|nr:hypothetical protein [Planctomycetota bacterium]
MAEVLAFCFAVLISIVVVALVGHGIWIAVEGAIRAMFGLPSRRGVREQRHCPFCRLLTPRSRDRCTCCGHDLTGPLAAELDDLAGLTRQLKRLQEAGVIEPSEVDDLLARANAYRTRLTGAGLAERAPESTEPEIVTAELVDEPVGPAFSPAAPPATEPTVQAAPALTPKRESPGIPEAPQPPQPPAKRKPPRKSWREVLTAFMEERNIHVAELIGVLVGGLLMVGASIALWISVKETLDAVPLFKFSVFAVYSGAVFGAGLFTHYRWRLDYTSRALLIIATLLVPLNFLAMARQGNWVLLNVAWEVVALGVFGYLVLLAAAVIVPRGRWFQVAAVVGNSAAVVWLARVPGIDSHGSIFLAVGGLHVALFAVPVGAYLQRLDDTKDLDPKSATELFSLLGTAAFTVAVALGLLVARAVGAGGALAAILDRTSVLFALAAIPILATGLTVVRSTTRDKTLGPYRTAGTMVALVAVGIMLAALAIAWPQPLAVMAVGVFNAAALVFVAFRYRFPVAHAGAIACMGLVYLTAYHVLAGNLALIPADHAAIQMLHAAASAQSGVALVGLFGLLAVAAEMLDRWGYRRHAEQYAGGSVVVALVSLLVVTSQTVLHRGADAPLATAVYAVYAVGCLLLNVRFRKPLLTYLGLGLLGGATLWGLWWRTGAVEPIWATVLAAEALVMGVAAVLLRRFFDRQHDATDASSHSTPPKPNSWTRTAPHSCTRPKSWAW